jgi:hypothetical protein
VCVCVCVCLSVCLSVSSFFFSFEMLSSTRLGKERESKSAEAEAMAKRGNPAGRAYFAAPSHRPEGGFAVGFSIGVDFITCCRCQHSVSAAVAASAVERSQALSGCGYSSDDQKVWVVYRPPGHSHEASEWYVVSLAYLS